jgi:hypothetical protein
MVSTLNRLKRKRKRKDREKEKEIDLGINNVYKEEDRDLDYRRSSNIEIWHMEMDFTLKRLEQRWRRVKEYLRLYLENDYKRELEMIKR